jgi:dihydroxy-acid dehydratase
MQKIAQEANCKVTLKEMDDFSCSTPYVAKVHPSGEIPFNALHAAGGVPAILKSLGDLIDGSQKSVSGFSIGQIAELSDWNDKNIIRPRDNPFAWEGGLRVLWGTLAPEGAVIKRSGVVKNMWIHRGPARVFENMEEAVKSVKLGSIEKGCVVVIRNEGPIGGPGMREMHLVTTLMIGTGLSDTTALVTDGRFSGATRGPCVGHISPEAAEGGPIAFVRDGDIISIDLNKGILDLEVPEEELTRRKIGWVQPDKENEFKGVLGEFIKMTKLSHKKAN